MKNKSAFLFSILVLLILKVSAQEDTLQWNSTGDSINYTFRKVGIGLSNPTVPLHIKGQITTDSLRVLGRIHVGPSSLWLGSILPITGGSDDITSTNSLISFGGEPSVTTFDDIQFTIGTQVGQQKLHISDGSSNAVRMQYTNSGTGTTSSDGFQIGILGGGSNGHAVFNQQENLPMLFNTNATERMRILGGGNIGINTTTPNNKLEITHGTSGNSGLRFTNLTNTSSSITNTTAKILSVDANGDVILVDDQTGGGGVNYCTSVPNDFLMKKDAATNNLCASGVYEVPSGTYINNIGIGSSTSNNLRSKLNVNGNTKIGSGYVATATSAPANGMVVEGNTGIGRSNGSGQLVEARLHVNTDASFTTFPSATQRNFFLGTASDRSGFRDAFTMFTSGTNGNETATIQAVGRGGDGQVEALVSTTGVRLTSAVNGSNAPGIEPVNQSNEVLALGGDTIFPNTTATGSTCSFTGAIFGDYTHHWGRVYTHDIWQSRSTNPRFFRIRPGNARDVNNTDCAMYLQTGILYNNASYFRIIGPPTGTGTNNFCQNGGIGSIVPLFEVAAGGNVGIRGFVLAGITGLWVNGDITVTGSYLPSDERIKKNIQEYHTGLDAIRQVNVKSYQYKTKLGITDTVDTKVGVIAQELMQVLPNAVDNFLGVLNDPADSTEAPQEILRINQNVILFTAINAIKELDIKNQALDTQNQELVNQNQALAQTLEQQNQRIDEILARLEQCCSAVADGNRSGQIPTNESDSNLEINSLKVELSSLDRIVLNQNEPNPFKEKTIIKYTIPNNVKQAEIIFFDHKGSIIKSVLVETRGFGQLEVYSSNLSAGTYSYSLVADGISIDTKKMVNVK